MVAFRQDMVKIPRAQMQTVLDQLSRAETAARQGARVASSAAAAFEQEGGIIADARAGLERILRAAPE